MEIFETREGGTLTMVFQQSSLAGLDLKNRIIRSATYEGLGDENGYPSKKLTDLYVRLARGGVGAIITGFACVQQDGRCYGNMCMIDDDKYIEAYQKMNRAVESYDVPLILQIAHCGGQADPSVTMKEVVAPSTKKYPGSSRVARELTSSEIEQIIDSFIKSIERAKKANFAGVQLHAAHGYLLSEFLSPAMNKRKDQWGGNSENRFRIIAEILKGAREKVGSYPILMKFSAYEGAKKGMRIEEAVKIAKMFEAAGGDGLEVSCGGARDASTVRFKKPPAEAIINYMPELKNLSVLKKKVIKMTVPFVFKSPLPIHNYNLEAARVIKNHVNIPVIVVGGIRKLEDMETIIGEGTADYVSLSRPFIIEPNLVNKFQTGKQSESRCIDCGYCIIGITANRLTCYHGNIK